MPAVDIPPTLRQWIIEQARNGQPPATVVQAMLAQGWQEEQAVDAVQAVLHDYLVE
ncbi:MAG TPA: 2-oxoglutarate-dependent dioxygenase, partial [Arenimonas sp.]|nr:2-oxoglutarate-dependent dioxygenase [Arenimonas sp.]